MAVRNILDKLSGGGSVEDTYFNSTTTNWSGAGNAASIITFVKTNNLCVIRITSFTIASALNAEFISDVQVPDQMLPKDKPIRNKSILYLTQTLQSVVFISKMINLFILVVDLILVLYLH